ncbi:AraC family transcriptional regulator [Sphingomonas sp. CL5.1]|nr:AraC family transcriptional regulator [Sphingomonas sp. CL5.1]
MQDAVNAGEQASIRLLFLTALIDALPEAGARIDPLLREHGFSRAQLASPYERAPLHRYVALLEHAALKFDRPYLGLDMGMGFGLAELGPFHALLTAADTLRTALDSLARFQTRWQSRTLLDAEIGPETTIFSYRIEDQRIWPRRQDAEFAIIGMVTLIKQLARNTWFPVEVRFEHSIAGREDRLARCFRAPVAGNHVANQIVVRNDDLDRPLAGAARSEDRKRKDILECHLLDLLRPDQEPAKSLAAQALDLIARRLGRAHVDCDSIAAELNLSGRSLRRRLLEEGTSFRNLLQEARQGRARAMLQASDVPLSVAAERLGYSDSATFSRAFKDWTGVSPGRFARKTD